jgi:hypothetical protein
LPEDEQTSKHGGGGRYNAILEIKGSKIKKRKKKKNEYKEKEIYIYIMYEKRKRKI